MVDPCRSDPRSEEPHANSGSIDEELLLRAAEINDSLAGEFAGPSASPLDNPILERMAELGVETNAAVSVALQRAQRIAFHMRFGRPPSDLQTVASDTRGLSAEERAQV